MRYRFGGLIFGGAYFRNFTVCFSTKLIAWFQKISIPPLRKLPYNPPPPHTALDCPKSAPKLYPPPPLRSNAILGKKLLRHWSPFKTWIPPLSFYYKEQSTAKSNSFKIAQKTAFEVKGRLYTTGKVIQRLFIIDLYIVSDISL